MVAPDESVNDGLRTEKNSTESKLEPVDRRELDLSEVPFVEQAEPRRRGFGFWKGLLWCLLFIVITKGLTIIVVGIVIAVAAFAGSSMPLDPKGSLASPEARGLFQLSILVDQIVTILFSLFILRWIIGSEWKERIALRLPSIKHVVLVLLAMPALLLFSIAVESVVVRYIPSLKQFGLPGVDDLLNSTNSWPWGIAVLAIGVGPAVGEELWCRGFLGQGLGSRYGVWWGVLLTSFFFGLIHVEPPQAVMAMIMGAVLHLSYVLTRSLLIPMLIHFLNNTVAILAISTTGHFPMMDTLETAYGHRPFLTLAASLCVLFAISVALYKSRVTVQSSKGKPVPASLYPHVEVPLKISPNRLHSNDLPVVGTVALLAAVTLFVAAWFGL